MIDKSLNVVSIIIDIIVDIIRANIDDFSNGIRFDLLLVVTNILNKFA